MKKRKSIMIFILCVCTSILYSDKIQFGEKLFKDKNNQYFITNKQNIRKIKINNLETIKLDNGDKYTIIYLGLTSGLFIVNNKIKSIPFKALNESILDKIYVNPLTDKIVQESKKILYLKKQLLSKEGFLLNDETNYKIEKREVERFYEILFSEIPTGKGNGVAKNIPKYQKTMKQKLDKIDKKFSKKIEKAKVVVTKLQNEIIKKNSFVTKMRESVYASREMLILLPAFANINNEKIDYSIDPNEYNMFMTTMINYEKTEKRYDTAIINAGKVYQELCLTLEKKWLIAEKETKEKYVRPWSVRQKTHGYNTKEVNRSVFSVLATYKKHEFEGKLKGFLSKSVQERNAKRVLIDLIPKVKQRKRECEAISIFFDKENPFKDTVNENKTKTKIKDDNNYVSFKVEDGFFKSYQQVGNVLLNEIEIYKGTRSSSLKTTDKYLNFDMSFDIKCNRERFYTNMIFRKDEDASCNVYIYDSKILLNVSGINRSNKQNSNQLLNQKKWNHIKIKCVDDIIKIYINDSLAIEHTIESLKYSGRISITGRITSSTSRTSRTYPTRSRNSSGMHSVSLRGGSSVMKTSSTNNTSEVDNSTPNITIKNMVLTEL